MTGFVLFGVNAPSLENARELVEAAIGEKLEESEGLHMGGIHYDLGFPDPIIQLKNNVDLDDEEMEANGLSEPDYPDHPWLLYVNDVIVKKQAADVLRKLEAVPDRFEKLRER